MGVEEPTDRNPDWIFNYGLRPEGDATGGPLRTVSLDIAAMEGMTEGEASRMYAETLRRKFERKH